MTIASIGSPAAPSTTHAATRDRDRHQQQVDQRILELGEDLAPERGRVGRSAARSGRRARAGAWPPPRSGRWRRRRRRHARRRRRHGLTDRALPPWTSGGCLSRDLSTARRAPLICSAACAHYLSQDLPLPAERPGEEPAAAPDPGPQGDCTHHDVAMRDDGATSTALAGPLDRGGGATRPGWRGHSTGVVGATRPGWRGHSTGVGVSVARMPDRRHVAPQGGHRREILRLAVPAFLALIAEPLFLLADSAIIGHLGTAQLAGLGVASATLLTAASIFVFLAYGTTARRRPPPRRRRRARRRSRPASTAPGSRSGSAPSPRSPSRSAAEPALRGSSAPPPRPSARPPPTCASRRLGIPAMLVVLAATGVLRGLQDTRTPLVASVVGFGANIVLNLALRLRIRAGASPDPRGARSSRRPAWRSPSSPCCCGMARRARREPAPAPRTRPARPRAPAYPLLVRTLALRAIAPAHDVGRRRRSATCRSPPTRWP